MTKTRTPKKPQSSDIKDLALADAGRLKIEWARESMPVLGIIRERFAREKPLEGLTIGACLHVTAETGNLMRTLVAGGAKVALCASNPLSTQDDVAASLVVHDGVGVFSVRGEDRDTYYSHIRSVLGWGPALTMDDGADLVSELHTRPELLASGFIGGTEETTTGVIRLRSMARQGVLRFPVVAVNDARTKHLFDNRYGTGQSTIDGIVRATNRLLAGSKVVVAGYGWCGRGVAMRARGMGALVVVTEVDPLCALEAVMDGYLVMTMKDAAPIGDVFVTVTGDTTVLAREHFEVMKSGAILANSGHFNVEIDIPALEAMAQGRRTVRPNLEQFVLEDGRTINLLAEGRLINLAAAEGHPAVVMDMSFANQALCIEHLVRNGRDLKNDVYPVPEAIDRRIAKLKLEALGVRIDRLTAQQERYLASWEAGT